MSDDGWLLVFDDMNLEPRLLKPYPHETCLEKSISFDGSSYYQGDIAEIYRVLQQCNYIEEHTDDEGHVPFRPESWQLRPSQYEDDEDSSDSSTDAEEYEFLTGHKPINIATPSSSKEFSASSTTSSTTVNTTTDDTPLLLSSESFLSKSQSQSSDGWGGVRSLLNEPFQSVSTSQCISVHSIISFVC